MLVCRLHCICSCRGRSCRLPCSRPLPPRRAVVAMAAPSCRCAEPGRHRGCAALVRCDDSHRSALVFSAHVTLLAGIARCGLTGGCVAYSVWWRCRSGRESRPAWHRVPWGRSDNNSRPLTILRVSSVGSARLVPHCSSPQGTTSCTATQWTYRAATTSTPASDRTSSSNCSMRGECQVHIRR